MDFFAKIVPQGTGDNNDSDEEQSIYEIKENFINVDMIVPRIPTIQPQTTSIKTKVKRQKYKNFPKPSIKPNDIFTIHKDIISQIKDKSCGVESQKKRLEQLEWIKNNTTDELEKIDATNQIFHLQKQINSQKQDNELKAYLGKATPLLEEYEKLPQHKSFIIFKTDPQEEKKKEIIKKFFAIAKNYVTLESPTLNQKQRCEGCNGEDFDISDEGMYSCLACGVCFQRNDETHSFRDTDRINLSTRYKYNKRTHFEEATRKFQGNQNVTVKPKVYEFILKKADIYSISKENLTKEQIYFFLSEGGFSRHYDDINLIHYNITGKKPPNISHLEKDLFQKFMQQEEIYAKVKNPARVNSLNVYYKLFKLLQLLRFKCSLSDFPTLKTRERLLEYDEIWKKICKELNWKFIPTIN